MHYLKMYVRVTANAKKNIVKYCLKLRCLYLVMLNIGTRWQSLMFYYGVNFELNLRLSRSREFS